MQYGIDAGIYKDLPMSEYVSAPTITRSHLLRFMDSPAQYAHERGWSKPPSEAMIFGSYVNDLLFDEELADTYKVIPPEFCDLRRKGAKAFVSALKAKHGQDKVIKQQAMFDANTLAARIREHPEAQIMLKGTPEVSLCWEEHGIMLGGRPDTLVYEKDTKTVILYDLKTSHDPHPAEFKKKYHNLGYYMQACLYRRGLLRLMDSDKVERIVCRYIVAGSSAPFLVAAYEIYEGDMEEMDAKLDVLIESFAACKHNDEWPAFGAEPMMLGLPAYAGKQIDSAISRVARVTSDLPRY